MDTALITVSGVLESSDATRFWSAAAIYPKAIVAFQSTGGSLIAGIEIGKKIRMRNYTTLVPTGVQCASACATAWLGGTKRLMGAGALIGFHAAYITQNGQTTETGAGNALLGAYLNELGLPDRAVFFITKAAPSDMTWLTMADAAREGIEVELFTKPADAPAADQRPIASPAARPTRLSLLTNWYALNHQCRGAGDDPRTLAACDRREEVASRLKQAGCESRTADSWVCKGNTPKCEYSDKLDMTVCR
jgi:hypothetical protein